MMKEVRELSEREADEISDRLEDSYLGRTYEEKSKSNWYRDGDTVYEIWLSNDSSCWVWGGMEYLDPDRKAESFVQ